MATPKTALDGDMKTAADGHLEDSETISISKKVSPDTKSSVRKFTLLLLLLHRYFTSPN